MGLVIVAAVFCLFVYVVNFLFHHQHDHHEDVLSDMNDRDEEWLNEHWDQGKVGRHRRHACCNSDVRTKNKAEAESRFRVIEVNYVGCVVSSEDDVWSVRNTFDGILALDSGHVFIANDHGFGLIEVPDICHFFDLVNCHIYVVKLNGCHVLDSCRGDVVFERSSGCMYEYGPGGWTVSLSSNPGPRGFQGEAGGNDTSISMCIDFDQLSGGLINGGPDDVEMIRNTAWYVTMTSADPSVHPLMIADVRSNVVQPELACPHVTSVLIVSADGNTSVPTAAPAGGTMIFQFEEAVHVDTIAMLAGGTSTFEFFDDPLTGTPVVFTTSPNSSANVLLSVVSQSSTRRLHITTTNIGALAEICIKQSTSASNPIIRTLSDKWRVREIASNLQFQAYDEDMQKWKACWTMLKTSDEDDLGSG
jgi:hypothetical protein